MIVIATNNGMQFLPECLAAWERNGTGGHQVCVVDTGSTDSEQLDFLDALRGKKICGIPYRVEQTPYRGYDSGAYIHMYRNSQEESYLFMQDSMRPKSSGIMEAFFERGPVVPWITFHQNGYDNHEQFLFVERHLGTGQLPGFGIFGPIFYATKEALDTVEETGVMNAIPSSKNEQMAMERGWAVAFAQVGLPVQSLDGHFDVGAIWGDGYQHFQKFIIARS